MADSELGFDLRTRIAAVIHKQNVSEYCGTIHPEDVLRLADAVIRELEAGYVLVPKSQTLTQQVNQPNPSYRPRLVANRDCTPLELPADWKPKLVNCAYCDYEGTPEELTTQHLNECP